MFSRTLLRKIGPVMGDSLREAARVAWDFATLGEASTASAQETQSAPTVDHPHRRHLSRPTRHGRSGSVAPRPQVCRTPLTGRSARPGPKQRTPTEHR